MKFTKRGQAALEFLTTYGWAFLVILVMIGALAYFGVLNPKSLLPGRCQFGPEIDCVEYRIVSDGNLSFRFRNNIGSQADFNFSSTLMSGGSPSVNCTPTYAGIAAGRINAVSCKFASTLDTGEKIKFEVVGYYKKSGGLYWTPVKGEVYGEVQ